MLFSLLVPGFGFIRAGQVRLGVLWLAGLLGGSVCAAVLVVWRAIPNWIAAGSVLALVLAHLWMLIASYRPGRMTGRLWLGFAVVVAALILCDSPSRLIAHPFTVPTASMQPTLMGRSTGATEDHFFVNRLAYAFSGPERGDLVVFRTGGIVGIPGTEDVLYVKRLVGFPDETIEIKEGRVHANGRQLSEADGIPNLRYVDRIGGGGTGAYHVPAGHYFVLGDNSERSADSRYFGSVPLQNLVGRVSRIYYPLSRISVPR